MSRQLQTLELEESKGIIGSSVLRIEDVPLITGEGRYVDDFQPPNCLHLALVRSQYAHARIKSIDVSEAKKSPGVVLIASGEDIVKMCKPIFQVFTLEGMKKIDVYPLATDRVRFVGEPLVAIVARSRELAKDAVELVKIEYEPLPVVVDSEQALRQDALLLYEEWGTNLMLHYKYVSGEVDSAFSKADTIVKERISVHRHSPVPMENNSYLATFEKTTGLTMWATTQNSHILRTLVSETLGLPETRVRVIEPDVGGGFGGKMPGHSEEILVPLFAVKLKSPVKFVEDRSEHLLASHQAREQVHYVEAAVTRDGKILGIRDKIIGNLGVYYPTCGPPSLVTASRFVPGCYKVPNYEAEVIGVATNKPPYGAYRGYGKDAANYVIEKLMDSIAHELDMDPVELRLRNIIRPEEFPYRSVTGALYDSGNYEKTMKLVSELVGYSKLRQEQREQRKNGKYLGIAVSLVLEPASSHFPNSLLVGQDGSTVRLELSGKVSVLTGVTSTGSGTRTAFAQIAAEELGVDVEDVTMIQGDTASAPFGYGMWASRGIVVGGNSVLLAARKLRQRILRLAGHLLNTRPEELKISDGTVESTLEPSRRITLKDLAATFYMFSKPLPRELIEGGLQDTVYYLPDSIETVPDKFGRRNAYATYGNSACAAVVQVDPETGVVEILRYLYVADAGRLINPMLVTGQVHGGVIQGLGGAIYEENAYDLSGQPLCTTFIDYLLPSSMESPEIEVHHLETPSPLVPLGAKGAGEGPTESAYAVLSNAVEDALKPFGVKIRELPLTPEKVWKQISNSKQR